MDKTIKAIVKAANIVLGRIHSGHFAPLTDEEIGEINKAAGIKKESKSKK